MLVISYCLPQKYLLQSDLRWKKSCNQHALYFNHIRHVVVPFYCDIGPCLKFKYNILNQYLNSIVNNSITKASFQVTETKLRIEGGMKPGHVITEIATEEKALMVVLGTRGMGTIRCTIMGSVSDYVVHHAHCPVVVCRQ